MLLPPVTFPAVDGLAVYPAQPALQDKTEGRTDALTATRTDSATYILQWPGDFVLPAIDVCWWNAGEGRVSALLKRHKGRTYDDINQFLPVETQMYVPKIEATLRKREKLALHDLKTPKG